MLSIFMWKREDQEQVEPFSSTIRYDRGADWFSEEVDGDAIRGGSRSYQLVALHCVGGDILCYQAIAMPTEWVGYDLLESKRVPYHCWRVTHEARWESIGGWERCMVEDTGKSVDTQWEEARAWMLGGSAPKREQVQLHQERGTTSVSVSGAGREQGGYRGTGRGRGASGSGSGVGRGGYRGTSGAGRGESGEGRGRGRGRDRGRGRGASGMGRGYHSGK